MSIAADLHRWIAPLGWALVHFLWQGVAVALVAWAMMTLSRGPRVRYAIGCAAMLAMLALPIAMLAWIGPDVRATDATAEDVPRLAGELARGPSDSTSAEARATSRARREVTLRERVERGAPLVVATWSVGVAVLATWHVVGLVQLARLRRGATRVVDAIWLDRVRALSTRLNVRRRVELLFTDRLDCPAVVGAIRPAILWPLAAMSGLTPTQIEALLAHELAHVRRHDYAVNLLQTLVETLLFYHPAVWWLSRRVRQEREHCCDDLAASIVGDRATYAGALAAMETLRQPTLAMSAGGGSLVRRVRRLLAPTATRRFSPVGLALIVTTFVLVGVFACKPREPVAAATAANSSASQPAAAMSTAARPHDRILVGDLVRVTVEDLFGQAVESVILKRVEQDGSISLPYIGSIGVVGETPSQAEAAIVGAYRKAQVLPRAIVGVLIVQDAEGHLLVPAELIGGGRARAGGEPSPQSADRDATQAKLQQQVAQLQAQMQTVAKAQTSAVASKTSDSSLAAVHALDAQRGELLSALVTATHDHGESSDEALAIRGLLSQLDQKIAAATGPIGEYYVSGVVGRPGVYTLGGRRITLMQALTAAGGTASPPVPDDDPSHDFGIDVVRRDVSTGQETRTRYRWSDVTHGKLATFYLVPNDQVFVGVGGVATTEPATTTRAAN